MPEVPGPDAALWDQAAAPGPVPAGPVPAAPVPPAPAPAAHVPAVPTQDDPWAGLFDRFSRELLVLTEQVRPAMDRLEREEEDPDRLQSLYQIDHGITRMRRRAQALQVLAGREDEEPSGHVTSLLDVVRVAESSIEQYASVSIIKVVELAVLAYAAEDLASLVAALLDNATRYSPTRATVSAHLLDSGAVMLRIEDAGIGLGPDQIDDLNRTLAGPVPPMTSETARHTGFPVVHRLARKHGVGVRLESRHVRAGGTIAMITVPASLLCEVPAEEAPRPQPRAVPGPGAGRRPAEMSHLTKARRSEPGRRSGERPASGATPGDAPSGVPTDLNGLPRRQRTSLRPVRARDTPEDGQPAGPAPGRSFAADLDAFTSGTRRPDPGAEPGARPDPGARPEPGPRAVDHDPEGRP